jgi:hypothetical protein
LLSVAGSSATFELKGTFPPFTAQVSISAARDEAYAPVTVVVTPELPELVCSGTSWVNLELRDGRGELYVPCGNSPVPAQARIEAQGEYAYLVGGGGKTLEFGFQHGRASFLVGLDTSKGIIPKGIDVGTIQVTVEGVAGEGRITFRCPYPPPEVRITTPAQDTTIELTQNNQPVIVLQETHKPASGRFEPTIRWEPSNRIDTKEYYEAMETGDTVKLVVKVFATNIAQMEATDRREIRLVKKGCDGPPCEGEINPPSLPLQEVKRSEMPIDPCLTPGKTGVPPAGGFRPLGAPEKPVGPFEVDACYDPQADRWKFKVGQIPIRVFLDLCENNLVDFKLINDVSEIVEADACLALEDIRRHYTYPIVVREKGYILRPILLAHEQVHKSDYQKALDEAKGVFEKKFIETQLACEEAGSLEEAKKKGEGAIRSHVMSLLTAAFDGYRTKTAPPDYEQTIQESLEQLIKQYEDRLKALHPHCK